jgi:hypothetical protein
MAFGKKEAVSVPALETKTVEFEIESMPMSSLVTHGWDPLTIQLLDDKKHGKPLPKKGARKLDEEAEFQATRYRMKDGSDGFPVTGFKCAMVSACRFIKGLPMTIAKGGFFLEADGMDTVRGIPLIKIEGKPVMREDIVRVGGAGPGTGAADTRFRAEFKSWKARLRVSFDAGQVDANMIANLIERAGFHVGVGEDRPEKRGGTWGRFCLKRTKEKKAAE